MVNYRTAIRLAEERLITHQKSAQLAKLFMLELTKTAKIELYLVYEEEISESLLTEFNDGVTRMLADEPMQHILGYEWFFGRSFIVNKDVLIPRPETEELVGHVLAKIDELLERKTMVRLVDVGCGSGAIAITLKLEEQRLEVLASDISEAAITVAKNNAKQLGAEVAFYVGSMLDPLIEANQKVDMIVCNPPYIPLSEQLDASVKEFEPNIALFGGVDGLYFYRLVFDRCEEVLHDQGCMAFEIGYDQKEALLAEVTKRFPHAKSEVLVDMYGKNRMLFVDFSRE